MKPPERFPPVDPREWMNRAQRREMVEGAEFREICEMIGYLVPMSDFGFHAATVYVEEDTRCTK